MQGPESQGPRLQEAQLGGVPGLEGIPRGGGGDGVYRPRRMTWLSWPPSSTLWTTVLR